MNLDCPFSRRVEMGFSFPVSMKMPVCSCLVTESLPACAPLPLGIEHVTHGALEQLSLRPRKKSSMNMGADPHQVEAGEVVSGVGSTGAGRSQCVLNGVRKTQSPIHFELSEPNEFACSALMSKYTRAGKAEEALRVYEDMQKRGLNLSSYTFVAALKACSSLKDLRSAKRIHAEVVKHRLESDIYVGTMLVDVYVKCKCLLDADAVFRSMPHHEVISWNALIMGYAQMERGQEALQLYSQMQEEGIVPNDRTFVGALKACSSLASKVGQSEDGGTLKRRSLLGQIRSIHIHAVTSGFELNVFVGTMLIDAYAKCGSLLDARNIFEKIPRRTVVSWNAIISGYTQMEEADGAEEALQLYTLMRKEGVRPDSRTFVAALKACKSLAELGHGADGVAIKSRCLRRVQAIHSETVKTGCESVLFVGTMLVDVYVKCGCLLEARNVFEKMPHRDVVSWTAMILGYAQMNEGNAALELYGQMQQEGVMPNSRTFVGALKACSSLVALEEGNAAYQKVVKKKCLEKVQMIHSQALESGSEQDIFVATMLVDVYVKCGSLQDAKRVFGKMPCRNVVSWTAMILGHVEMEEANVALHLYAQMQQEGIVPDAYAYVGALKACSSLATSVEGSRGEGKAVTTWCVKQVKNIHSQVITCGLELTVFVGTMLVDAYAKCGSLRDARCVFERMTQRDVVSWNAMILGYAQMEDGAEALRLYARMQQEGVAANGRTFVAALKGCSSLAVLEQESEGHRNCVRKECLQRVVAIHEDVLKCGFESDIFVGNMLVDAYAKCGSLIDARRIFEQMPSRDVVTWSAMLVGYAQMEHGEEALELYAQMLEEGVVPNDRTFVGALMACGVVADLKKGKQVHAHILEQDLDLSDLFVASSLVDMYAKCGSMADAQLVFHALPTRDIVTWNALIAGYARQGESKVVFDLFDRMQHEGIQPETITFLNLLTVCNHVGLVDQGEKYFEAMSKDFGINPTVEHYTCMVDLLGRAGQVEKAMGLAKKVESNEVVWKTLLGACRKWNKIELGRQAFERAVSLDKSDSAPYVLMSNIYAAARMWEEAQEIQLLREKSKAWKQQGQSRLLDSSGATHTFMVGDAGHVESPRIETALQHLFMMMKEDGHATDHDGRENEKHDAISAYAEGLA